MIPSESGDTEAPSDEPMSKAAAARYLGIGISTLRRLIKDGTITPEPRRSDLDAYLAEAKVQPGTLAHLCMWDR